MFKWVVNVFVYDVICWLRFSLDYLKKPLKK
jgi:hypothetical protein